jgi:hypothetical protein
MLKTIGQDLNLKGRENEDSVVHVDWEFAVISSVRLRNTNI